MSFPNKQGVVDRLEAAAKARSEMLARFRARPTADDPAVLARQSARRAVVDAREARAAERAAQRQAELERAAAQAEAERHGSTQRGAGLPHSAQVLVSPCCSWAVRKRMRCI